MCKAKEVLKRQNTLLCLYPTYHPLSRRGVEVGDVHSTGYLSQDTREAMEMHSVDKKDS